jgi:N-methylhydantoinase A/oxoprolinase/acetone carboxylase beta subunit
VGGSRTHVRALEIRTIGLGGDSLIRWDRSGFAIGPRRVAPVSWTGFHDPETEKALDFIECSPEQYTFGAVNVLQVLSLASEPPEELTPTARRVLSILRTRPFTIAELIDRAGVAYEGALAIAPLEARGIIRRSGPTPMDLLHVTGRFTEWDRTFAERYLRLMARLVGKEPEEMVDGLLLTVTRRMTLELLKRQLDDDIDDPEAIDRCPACNAILGNIFAGGGRHWQAGIHLKRPVIGIGAPVGFFLPQAAAFLKTEVIIPDHADVANAIGAITSQVVVTRRLRIVADPDRTFAIQGMAGTHRFTSLSEADGFARTALTRMVIQEGLTAGTRSEDLEFFTDDRTLKADDGTDLFKCRIITARLAGAPDLASLPQPDLVAEGESAKRWLNHTQTP